MQLQGELGKTLTGEAATGKARGMLADKQGVNSIAEELQCEAWEIQELADAKPKAVRRPICTGLLPCLSRPLRAFGLAA